MCLPHTGSWSRHPWHTSSHAGRCSCAPSLPRQALWLACVLCHANSVKAPAVLFHAVHALIFVTHGRCRPHRSVKYSTQLGWLPEVGFGYCLSRTSRSCMLVDCGRQRIACASPARLVVKERQKGLQTAARPSIRVAWTFPGKRLHAHVHA